MVTIRRVSTQAAGVVLAVSAAAVPALAQDAEPATTRVSVGNGGLQANGGSLAAQVSSNCNVIAFGSYASNLAPGDTKKFEDVFARNRATQKTTLVSRAIGGERANGPSRPNSVSADGSLVAYDSGASNLVPGDTNGSADIFVRDLAKKRSELISVGFDGAPADGFSFLPSMSASGRYVAFYSDAENLVDEPEGSDLDVFVRDRQEQTTELISKGVGGTLPNGGSGPVIMSANGRYVVYESAASNLVENDENTAGDVFRYDRETGETELVSVSLEDVTTDLNAVADDVSANGRYVSFTTARPDMVDGYVDENVEADVFVRDMKTGTTRIASIASDGSAANSFAFFSSISRDGNVVTFDSQASNLAGRDTNKLTDVFVHYLDSGVTKRISVTTAGRQSPSGGSISDLGRSGRCAAFSSDSALVGADTNGTTDVYFRRFGPAPPPPSG